MIAAGCTYEVICSPPDPSDWSGERWLFEWTLDWADCPDVQDVSVSRSDEPDAFEGGEADELLQISIETAGDCEETGQSDCHEQLLEALEEVAEVFVVACYPAPTAPVTVA